MARGYRQYNVHMTDSEDERLKAVAGPGNLGRFVREAILEKLERDQSDYQVVDDEEDEAPDIFGDEG